MEKGNGKEVGIPGVRSCVLFADGLNAYMFLGQPLGFWFAQQGAVITFVLLILIYALAMGRLDRRLQAELLQLQQEQDA